MTADEATAQAKLEWKRISDRRADLGHDGAYAELAAGRLWIVLRSDGILAEQRSEERASRR